MKGLKKIITLLLIFLANLTLFQNTFAIGENTLTENLTCKPKIPIGEALGATIKTLDTLLQKIDKARQDVQGIIDIAQKAVIAVGVSENKRKKEYATKCTSNGNCRPICQNLGGNLNLNLVLFGLDLFTVSTPFNIEPNQENYSLNFSLGKQTLSSQLPASIGGIVIPKACEDKCTSAQKIQEEINSNNLSFLALDDKSCINCLCGGCASQCANASSQNRLGCQTCVNGSSLDLPHQISCLAFYGCRGDCDLSSPLLLNDEKCRECIRYGISQPNMDFFNKACDAAKKTVDNNNFQNFNDLINFQLGNICIGNLCPLINNFIDSAKKKQEEIVSSTEALRKIIQQQDNFGVIDSEIIAIKATTSPELTFSSLPFSLPQEAKETLGTKIPLLEYARRKLEVARERFAACQTFYSDLPAISKNYKMAMGALRCPEAIQKKVYSASIPQECASSCQILNEKMEDNPNIDNYGPCFECLCSFKGSCIKKLGDHYFLAKDIDPLAVQDCRNYLSNNNEIKLNFEHHLACNFFVNCWGSCYGPGITEFTTSCRECLLTGVNLEDTRKKFRKNDDFNKLINSILTKEKIPLNEKNKKEVENDIILQTYLCGNFQINNIPSLFNLYNWTCCYGGLSPYSYNKPLLPQISFPSISISEAKAIEPPGVANDNRCNQNQSFPQCNDVPFEEICGEKNDGCSQNDVNKWDSQIEEGIKSANVGNPLCQDKDGNPIFIKPLIKAIMARETGGGTSPDKDALGCKNASSTIVCGIMQLSKEIFDQYGSNCGIPNNIIPTNIPADGKTYPLSWFSQNNQPINVDKQVCVAAKHLAKVANQNAIKCDLRKIIAYYNGGSDAVQDSNTCANCNICNGYHPMKWECLWTKNNNNIKCDTGYSETRRYVPRVLYCYNHVFLESEGVATYNWCKRNPPNPQKTLNWKFQEGVNRQIGDASQGLVEYITCLYNEINKSNLEEYIKNSIVISAISSNTLCNNPNCDITQEGCGHTAYSCHFGGRKCQGYSHAVDFVSNATTVQGLKNILNKAKEQCDKKTNPETGKTFEEDGTWLNEESDHIHISIMNNVCECR
jgi:hypothetical protein